LYNLRVIQGIVKRHLPDYVEGSAFFRGKASAGEASFSICEGKERYFMHEMRSETVYHADIMV